jgi:hypothetical protein
MRVEDERHATRFAEASVSEPNTRRVVLGLAGLAYGLTAASGARGLTHGQKNQRPRTKEYAYIRRYYHVIATVSGNGTLKVSTLPYQYGISKPIRKTYAAPDRSATV